ncbi:MAG TPA: hypothetical protein VH559_11100 [Gemmatimonadaceae bacterium]
MPSTRIEELMTLAEIDERAAADQRISRLAVLAIATLVLVLASMGSMASLRYPLVNAGARSVCAWRSARGRFRSLHSSTEMA